MQKHSKIVILKRAGRTKYVVRVIFNEFWECHDLSVAAQAHVSISAKVLMGA